MCAGELIILNEAQTPPFAVDDDAVVNDSVRYKYRYIDLRRPAMQHILRTRSNIAASVRSYFGQNGFAEIETPVLCKSTPEGARDYLVPSRVHPGKFYALPQSPQLLKQLLMVSGMDRYYQIVKCFRDEDLRADRQPEFTQIDVEMSFADQEQIMEICEGLLRRVFRDIAGYEISEPIEKMTYRTAMEKYGSDKPDLRFGMEINDISDIAKDCGFSVFSASNNIGRERSRPARKIHGTAPFPQGDRRAHRGGKNLSRQGPCVAQPEPGRQCAQLVCKVPHGAGA